MGWGIIITNNPTTDAGGDKRSRGRGDTGRRLQGERVNKFCDIEVKDQFTRSQTCSITSSGSETTSGKQEKGEGQ